jgi:N-acetylglutamate synthase-like GNAT family acetyltransferase
MTNSSPAKKSTADIAIEQLQEQDLDEADRIFRLAFGTFMGLPNPNSFAEGADYIRTRWTSSRDAFFAAKHEGRLFGTNFATNWGTVGFFGPLTIHPDYWDRGIGKLLLEPIIETFSRWQTKHAGLFTFAQSAKHVGLYQKFGFWPRFLTTIMSLQVGPTLAAIRWQKFSKLSGAEQKEWLKGCRDLTNEIYEGLDLEHEIAAVETQKLGDTVLLSDNSRVVGLAVCHCGPGTEAGPDTCYIKFGAVRPGAGAATRFEHLISACEELAAQHKLARINAGVNIGRTEAYQLMLERGFRTAYQGVAMHRPNENGYNRPGVYAIDDWR